MNKEEIIQKIKKLKKEKKAYIIAHVYEIPEIQELADMVGDSLALSRHVREIEQDLVVFCGVYFMAETAKILSPEKTILLPDTDAGCPMADMAEPDAIKELKAKHSDAAVVCYVNSSAATKAECDICCTSSNAVKIVQSLEEDKFIFIPDRNLGGYVARQIPEKEAILWEGYCPVHNDLTEEQIIQIKEMHPDAEILVHPECPDYVVKHAHFTGSTAQILDYAKETTTKKLIIGTEEGVMHPLHRDNPDKEFILLTQRILCEDMKKITLEALLESLEKEQYSIEVDEEIRKRALKSLEAMLAVS
jgi:quinolinate synthase